MLMEQSFQMFLQKQLQLLPNKPDNLALWLDAKIENLILIYIQKTTLKIIFNKYLQLS